MIPKGNHHLERSSAFREAERGVEKTRFAMAPRRWRWGPRCWPHAWLPWARAWALSKGAIRPRYASRKMASSARTPHFSIARWPRDGKIHAPRALDALEACPKKLTSSRRFTELLRGGSTPSAARGTERSARGTERTAAAPQRTVAARSAPFPEVRCSRGVVRSATEPARSFTERTVHRSRSDRRNTPELLRAVSGKWQHNKLVERVNEFN